MIIYYQKHVKCNIHNTNINKKKQSGNKTIWGFSLCLTMDVQRISTLLKVHISYSQIIYLSYPLIWDV
jgi:hypothetical protein